MNNYNTQNAWHWLDGHSKSWPLQWAREYLLILLNLNMPETCSVLGHLPSPSKYTPNVILNSIFLPQMMKAHMGAEDAAANTSPCLIYINKAFCALLSMLPLG